jgi:hypothetical protein
MESVGTENVAPKLRDRPLPLKYYCNSPEDLKTSELATVKRQLLGLKKIPPPLDVKPRDVNDGGKKNQVWPRTSNSITLRGDRWLKLPPTLLPYGDSVLDALPWKVIKSGGYDSFCSS